MKCENCNAYNAHVIKVNMGDEYILCPRCLKILEQLDGELDEITQTPFFQAYKQQIAKIQKLFLACAVKQYCIFPGE